MELHLEKITYLNWHDVEEMSDTIIQQWNQAAQSLPTIRSVPPFSTMLNRTRRRDIQD